MKPFWISLSILIIGTAGTFLLSGAIEGPGLIISFFLSISLIVYLQLFLYEKKLSKLKEIEEKLDEIKSLIK